MYFCCHTSISDLVPHVCVVQRSLPFLDLTSIMRAIDQFTMITAPILTGLLMSFGTMQVSAAVIAAWNVVSVVIEYFLLVAVYNRVPDLAVKYRDASAAGIYLVTMINHVFMTDLLDEYVTTVLRN